MSKSKIDYLDYTVNAIMGCTHGCYYCWARNRMAPRMRHLCKLCGEFKPHFHEERLKLIDKIKKPSIVGLNFMGDTYDKGVLPMWREAIFHRIVDNLQNHYIILTKQPQNIKEEEWVFPMRTLWVGVSIGNRDHTDRWVALSQKDYIRHKIISFEPVLDYFSAAKLKSMFEYGRPSWIIIGALTGFAKYDMRTAESKSCAKQLLDALAEFDIPLFVKDNCEIKGAPRQFPEEIRS